MPTMTLEPTERRQAVWPWILMPLVVLVVAYTLKTFHDAAERHNAQTQIQMSGADVTQP
jgi:hypothetical protein